MDGLCRLLPLPWAKTTRPRARSGTVSRPGSRLVPALTYTSSSRLGGSPVAAGTASLARVSSSITSSSVV